MTQLINVEFLRHDILVHFGDSEELYEFLEGYYEKYDVYGILNEFSDLFSGAASGKCLTYDGNIIMAMAEKPHDADTFGILSHEVFHVVNMLMNKIGNTFTNEGEEVYAYLVGFLTKKIITTFGLSLQQSREGASSRSQEEHNDQ